VLPWIMAVMSSVSHREVAEAAWHWVLSQVGWDDDGPWIPESAPGPMSRFRDGLHSGIGGLAHVLAEIRLSRAWTAEEENLAEAITERLAARIPTENDYTYFDGLVSTIGVLTALDAPGAPGAVDRLIALATPDGWSQDHYGPPRFLPGSRVNDLVLGTAGVLLGAVWAARTGLPRARDLGELAAGVLMNEMEPVPTGANWRFIPTRFRTDPGREAPNLSHGLAGIATTLALAGAQLDRADLTNAARRGAEHLTALGATDGEGFAVPVRLPRDPDQNEFTYNWCHGPAGVSLLFLALHRAGVEDIAGAPPLAWHRRCLHSVRTSGLPARRYPGFWDNDGLCCGTAGVGEIFLNHWQHGGEPDDLRFALHLADTVVEHAVLAGPHAYWRFTEHRAAEPLLPPGVGWYQGAAGIAAFLFHVDRVERDGRAAAVAPRMDTWWATRSD
jgi:hypothetical protein